MENKIQSLLCELGISDEDSIIPFYPKVRDNDNISVMRCRKSGVIFLSRSDHITISDYKKTSRRTHDGFQDRKRLVLSHLEDCDRRYERYKYVISNKKWIDVGAGSGGMLDLLSSVALETVAVEPQEKARSRLIECGYRAYTSIEDVPDCDFGVATLFHVLEHLDDPMTTLDAIKRKMKKGGKIIIEVPHAKDFMIAFLNLDKYKEFTFWSEHLMLHTRESLNSFLEKSGFINITIQGYQRYPLANHLYWLAKGKPRGHIEWDCLRTKMLDEAYTNMLAQLDCTDTLIAVAQA